jgi:uncharacterized protein (DUF302 family)
MKDESALVHCERVSERAFDEVVAAFEKAVPLIEGDALREIVSAPTTDAHDFENRVCSWEGLSGFMRFLDIDHGAWLSLIGPPSRCKLYTLGNPLVAHTMLKLDLGVGLHVPVWVMISADQKTGKTRLVYDLPSSLMARLGKHQVNAAAQHLNEKQAALPKAVTGVAA